MSFYKISEAEVSDNCELLFDRLYTYWQGKYWPSEKADMGGEIMGPNAIKLFIGFDSKFFEPKFKESRCVYRGTAMLGREFNYYFQGIAFKSFEQTKQVMRNFMTAWKAHYVIPKWVPWLGQEGAIHIVSNNDWMMAQLGYDEHDGRWRDYCVKIVDTCARYHESDKVQRRYRPLPPIYEDLLKKRMIRVDAGLPIPWQKGLPGKPPAPGAPLPVGKPALTGRR